MGRQPGTWAGDDDLNTPSDQWSACFHGLHDSQAARIREALEGLPENVLQFVRTRVQFVCPASGTIMGSHMGKCRGHARLAIFLPGVDGQSPVPSRAVLHEVAHAFLGHPWTTPSMLRRRGFDPRVHRAKCELDAWRLVHHWMEQRNRSPVPRAINP